MLIFRICSIYSLTYLTKINPHISNQAVDFYRIWSYTILRKKNTGGFSMNSTQSTWAISPQNTKIFAKKQFSSPLFLVMTIVCTLACAANIVALAMGYSIFDVFTKLLSGNFPAVEAAFEKVLDMSYMVVDKKGNEVINSIWLTHVLTAIPNVFVVLGMWLVYISALAGGREKLYKVGFTAMQVVKFNMIIVSAFFMLTNGITLFRTLEDANLPGTAVVIYKVLIVLISLFILFFNARTVALFAFWKETAGENSPVPQIPVIIPFTTVAGGSAVTVTTVMYAIPLGDAATELSFLLPAGAFVLLSVAAIVSGLFIFSYKAKIEEFVSADEK